MAAEPFPFATLAELQARWPDFPTGADAYATTLLEDASQFILDTVPSAELASPLTRRRVVCAVVRRAMSADEYAGMETIQSTTGPISDTFRPTNPHGDFYLTKPEKKALGGGSQKAFGVQVGFFTSTIHAYHCDLNFGGLTCSCGADIAGEPIYGGA